MGAFPTEHHQICLIGRSHAAVVLWDEGTEQVQGTSWGRFPLSIIKSVWLAGHMLLIDRSPVVGGFGDQGGVSHWTSPHVFVWLTGHMQLTDFGLAKWLQGGSQTRTVCGTLQYMGKGGMSADRVTGEWAWTDSQGNECRQIHREWVQTYSQGNECGQIHRGMSANRFTGAWVRTDSQGHECRQIHRGMNADRVTGAWVKVRPYLYGDL